MKKFLLALVISLGCFASFAEGDWRETCGKIVELGGDTGIAGFVKRLAPAYMTGRTVTATTTSISRGTAATSTTSARSSRVTRS